MGYTLIEVMISVILLSLLIGLAAPLGTLVNAFKLDYVNHRIYGSALLARSEAIKRGSQVSICRSVTGLACDTTSTDWSSGWVIFENPNNNTSIDTGEDIIRVYNVISSPLKITWSNGNHLTFTPRGNPVGGTASFSLCMAGRTAAPTRAVTITLTGQIRKASAIGDCL